MKIFESLNFDVILILILISSTILGLYLNIYRQGRRSLSLILPFIILFLLFKNLYNFIIKFDFINNAYEYIVGILKIKTYHTVLFALIIYLVCYIVLAIIISSIYGLFKVSVQKRVLNKKSSFSRLVGSILGFINGYIIGVILIFVLNPLISLNYEKPITKIYNESATDVLEFLRLNEFKNVNTWKYKEYEEILGQLTGRNALNNYNEILDIFKTFDELELEFVNNLIPSISNESKSLIMDDNILFSFIQNSDKILENEKNNEKYNILKDSRDYLKIHKADLKIYNSIDDYEINNLCDYIETNYADLLAELSKDLYKDLFIKRFDYIKEYIENKAEFLSLIDHSETNISEDVIIFEKYLNTNTDDIINSFYIKYREKDTLTLQNLDTIFKKYLENKEKINSLNYHLSLSIKIILSERYNYYFSSNKYLNRVLIKTYLIDSLTDISSEGYKLYSEYFFYSRLVNEINLDELDQDEFLDILNNLDELVVEGFLSETEAQAYFGNLFTNESKYFYNLLNEELVNALKDLDNKYITESILMLIS